MRDRLAACCRRLLELVEASFGLAWSFDGAVRVVAYVGVGLLRAFVSGQSDSRVLNHTLNHTSMNGKKSHFLSTESVFVGLKIYDHRMTLSSLAKITLLNRHIHHLVPANEPRRTYQYLPPPLVLLRQKPERRNLRKSDPAQEEHHHGFLPSST